MLEIYREANLDIWEWEDLRCPYCGDNHFVSIDHSGVYCDTCNTKFSVRSTAGDPGCVIDVFPEKNNAIYAPAYRCECGKKDAFFDYELPECPFCGKTPEREEGILRAWKPPVKESAGFSLILKLGDYCSGWMCLHRDALNDRLSFPTQNEWDQFQGIAEPTESGLVRGARFMMIRAEPVAEQWQAMYPELVTEAA